MSSRRVPANSSWKQMPTTPPESPTASSWRSVRLRSCGVSAAAHAWVTTSGRCVDRGHVPEAALVEVREVDEDAELLARAHERAAGVGQAALGGHAVGERVRPAPRRADRAQPERVQRGQQLEAGVDRLGALDVHDGEDGAAELEVAGRARHAHRSRPLEREQLADARERVADGEVVLDGRLRLAVGRIAVGVRREDREEAAREPAGAGAREVEVPLVRARRRTSGRASSTSLCPSKTGMAIAIR